MGPPVVGLTVSVRTGWVQTERDLVVVLPVFSVVVVVVVMVGRWVAGCSQPGWSEGRRSWTSVGTVVGACTTGVEIGQGWLIVSSE